MTNAPQPKLEDPSFAGASALAAAIRSRRLGAVELLEHLLERIARFNPRINAIVTLDEEGARRRARAADDATSRGESWGPLHGVPFTLKDGLATSGLRTTCGFPPLADYVPKEDSTVAARLRAAGGILLGKTNVPPLLALPQTDNEIFGRTNNPWNLERTPGGSSGGAAAALAAGLVPLEVGSDLAGSIRMPAHFCGVFGLKPTTRRIPLTGHIPEVPGAPRFERALGVVGPMARSVEDLTLAFRLLAGPDGRDTDVAPVPVSEPAAPPLRSLRIAFAPTFPGVPVARAIRDALERLAGELASAGARVEEKLPAVSFEEQHQLWAKNFRWFAWMSVHLSGAPATERTRALEPPTAVDLLHMAQRRDELILAWDRLFDDFDVLLCPPAMVTAFPHIQPSTPISVDGVPATYGQINHHCFPFNLTGQPAVVLPIAIDDEGLPIGAQLVGRRWQDERLLAITARVSGIPRSFHPPPGF
ncbi:MAG: amidase [bacterium]